jgi:HPt (histidine-containing phosphotransfer) domain-containing protein
MNQPPATATSPGSPTAPEPIDAQWLARMRERKPEFLRQLFAVFLEEEPKRFAALAQAVAAGDGTLLRHQAHALKGAAATLGMQPLSDACRELEHAAKGECSRPQQECLDDVRARLEAVFTAIRAILSGEAQ